MNLPPLPYLGPGVEIDEVRYFTTFEVLTFARQAQSEALAAAVSEMKEALCVAICVLFSTDPQDVTNTFTDAELEQVLDITKNLKPESVEGVYRKTWDFLAAAQETKP